MRKIVILFIISTMYLSSNVFSPIYAARNSKITKRKVSKRIQRSVQRMYNKNLFEKGMNYRQYGNEKLAERYFKLAIKFGNNDALIELGTLYNSQGKNKLAERYWKSGARKNSMGYYRLGQYYFKNKRYLLADKYFQMSSNALDENFLYYIGTLYYREEQEKIGDKYYKLAFEKGDSKFKYSIGHLYFKKENYFLAEKYWKILADSGDLKGQDILGRFYYSLDEPEKAEIYLKIAADKGEQLSQFALSAIYHKQMKYDLSLEYLTMTSNNQLTRYNELTEKSLELYSGKMILETNHEFAVFAANNRSKIAQEYLIDYYNKVKNYVEMEKYFVMLTDESNDKNIQFALGRFYQEILINEVQAEKYLKIAANQGHEGAQYTLGNFYIERKLFVLAEEYLKLSARNEKYQERSKVLLGMVYFENGKEEIAEEYLSQYAESDNEAAIFLLGKLYKKQMKYQMAKELLLKIKNNKIYKEQVLVQLGEVAYLEREFLLAEKYWKKNNSEHGNFNLGYLYYMSGNYELVRKYWGIDIDCKWNRSRISVGHILVQLKKYDLAKYYLESFISDGYDDDEYVAYNLEKHFYDIEKDYNQGKKSFAVSTEK
ncbi:tetratricopeptide repeat protein [Fusobacterium sp. PH5-44]|uniref:tetratricopeptide repeat protein n=1 Tax=unclassified Fusobacterium TaxID=2648384 RepID=UPI003D194814